MQEILDNYERDYGYVPSKSELLGLYTSGSLELTDEQEDILAALL